MVPARMPHDMVSLDWQPALLGELLELRPLPADDFQALFRAAADPLIWEQHPDRDRYQETTSRYHGCDPASSVVEIGWSLLARAYWGGRYNGEMKRLMLEHAFGSVSQVICIIGRRIAVHSAPWRGSAACAPARGPTREGGNVGCMS
jgi:N-acetyltransferase